jgi:hypothetical protein
LIIGLLCLYLIIVFLTRIAFQFKVERVKNEAQSFCIYK